MVFDRIVNNVVHVYTSIRVYTREKRLGISNTPLRPLRKSAIQTTGEKTPFLRARRTDISEVRKKSTV